MSLIDNTYFQGDIIVPNIGGVGDLSQSVTDRLDQLIAEHEPILLTALLGEDLYTLFTEGLKAETIDERYVALKNLFVDEDLKKSAIAFYIYYKYKAEENILSSGIGDVIPMSENSARVSSDIKAAQAYNKGRRLFIKVLQYLIDNSEIYPEWSPNVFTGIEEIDVVTDFATVDTFLFTSINTFGI